MKTIVIPAHCGSACIDQLKLALKLFPDEAIHCIFVQVRPMPDNYNDMMTLRKKTGKYGNFDEAFSRSLSLLRSHYKGRLTAQTDYIYGDSPSVFRNYVKHHEANLVIYDNKEWKDKATGINLNIFRMVRRCGCELMYISRENNTAAKPVSRVIDFKTDRTPESVSYHYSTIDQQLDNLNDILNSNKIISKKINNLSRYFLNESLLQKMLVQSECSLLLLKK